MAAVLGVLTGRPGAWLFTIAVAAAAIAVFVLLIIPAPAYDPADELPWPLFALAFAVAEIAVIHIMFRNQAVTISLSEFPLVVGFYFVAPPYLVVAHLVGAGVALVLHRRQPPLKLAFNLSIFALGSSLAILVFREVALLGPSSVVVWWLASFAGTTTVVVVSAFAVSAVISISQGRVELAALRVGLAFGLLAALVNTSIALIAVVFIHTESAELWLLVAPAAVGLLGYRAFGAQRQREARLEFLYDCTQILQGPVLDEAKLVRLLARTRDMFRAGTVEALLEGASDRAAMRVSIDPDGRPKTDSAGSDVVAGRMAMLALGGGGRLVEDEAPTGEAWPAGVRGAMIVPIRGAGGIVGTLMVAGQLDDLSTFGTEDLRVLETLASRLGLVAENSGLVKQLSASLADVTQLAAIVESSADAIVAVAADGEITAWNPAATRLFGYEAAQVLGRVGSEVLPESNRGQLRDSFAAILSGAPIRNVRTEWLRNDGTLVMVSITLSPIRGTAGETTGVSAIVRDESERARVEAAVAASSELFRTVIDGSPLGMGVAGPDHRWIQANPALCALLGTTAEETIGRSTLDRMHPDDRDTVGRLEERIFDDESAVRSVERRYVDLTGRVVLTNVSARLIREPSSDKLVALYTLEDITDRRQVEEQLRSTEERFREAALAISAVRDPARVLRAVLESARKTLRAEYAIIATYSDVDAAMVAMEVDGPDPGELFDRLGRWLSATGVGGSVAKPDRPTRLRDLRAHPAFASFPNGHPVMTSLLAVPIPQGGEGSATLFLANKVGADEFSEADETIAVALATHAAVCLDNARVHARSLELVRDLDRANLELMRASEAKSQFLASVAHELRTPLHAIVIAGQLVHDPPASPLTGDEVKALGVTIESSGRHMVDLLDDLVDLSRIETGHLEIRPTQVMLGVVLSEVASNLALQAETNGITLDVPDDPGPAVFADPVRLRQILMNLVSNALKYTERGGRAWVEVNSTHAATRITVHDTGIGIAADDLERAFLPFEQVSGASTTGAGLGLAISRSLAELHGGDLSAVSRPGVGSAFTLTLPHGPEAPSGTPAKVAATGPVLRSGGGRPILVVEDDATAMSLVTEVLRMADYEVWPARGLGEATALLDIATPALILLDVRLADGSGLDLVERLRSDGTHADLPILALSADAMPDDERRAREAGCRDFLAKPVGPRVLLMRIADLIGRATERD